MKILEYGNINNPKIILVHGFQSPIQVWDEYINHFKDNYYIIVPILPGHYPNHEEKFTTFQDVTNQFEVYYLNKFGDEAHMVFAMSMGGVFVSLLWQNNKIHFKHILFDGSPLLGYNKFFNKYMTSFYLNVTKKSKERNEKTLNQAIKSIIKKQHLNDFLNVLDNMDEDTIKSFINEIGSHKLLSTNNQTSIHYFHGTKLNETFSKKTGKFIKKHYKNSNIICFKNKGHCEVSIFKPMEMFKYLDNIIKE